jgi:hypothetical protein
LFNESVIVLYTYPEALGVVWISVMSKKDNDWGK